MREPHAVATAAAEEALAPIFARAGFSRADVALLQPAEPFIDLSGEDIRRRLFLTQDGEGRELCLRPEFTIPLCRALAASEGVPQGAFWYLGPVFRHRPGESGEFLQAGVESVGRSDGPATDAEIAALALEAADRLGGRDARMVLGDVALLDALLAALKVAPSAARRLKRRLAAGRPPFPEESPARRNGVDRFGGVLAALEGAGPQAASAFVADMLSMSGAKASGGRSVDEIAARFLAKAHAGDQPLSEAAQAIIQRFLALSGHCDHVAEELRRLSPDLDSSFAAAIDAFETRTGFIAAAGVDLGRIDARPRFLRNLDYYTGLCFEVRSPALAGGKPLVGGGRYDGLLARLGAREGAPAVGFSVWIERFAGGRP